MTLESGKPDVTDEDLQAFKEIQLYVKTKTYLEENDPKFWEKLVDRLGHGRSFD